MAKAPSKNKGISTLMAAFREELNPLEQGSALALLKDKRTDAQYCECHVLGSKLVSFGTTSVPLDPANQSEYRANRTVTDEPAFRTMKADALKHRSFSNIVTEYVKESEPLKIIGGQHRFEAIKEALAAGVDELHGIKVYFGLNMTQRLDVQLISNTNIDVSGALVDRLQETYRGPNLRNWCQEVGLLKEGQDFGDKKARGGTITVDLARTFIKNFYGGKKIDPKEFGQIETTPMLFVSGKGDEEWGEFLLANPGIWKDAALKTAGKQFVRLIAAQRAAFLTQKKRADFSEKAMNAAVMSAWAYVAGMLQKNTTRLERHFALADAKGKDPLNAQALAEGKHKTDESNYRGLGYRVDPRERAQMVELFYILAEDGDKITAKNVNAAIYARFAKQAVLDAKTKRGK